MTEVGWGQGHTCASGRDKARGLRIGIMLPDFGAGGAERVAISLASGFGATGCRQGFIVLQTRREYLREVAGLFVVRALGVRRYRQTLPALVGLLRREPPEELMGT